MPQKMRRFSVLFPVCATLIIIGAFVSLLEQATIQFGGDYAPVSVIELLIFLLIVIGFAGFPSYTLRALASIIESTDSTSSSADTDSTIV